MEKYLERQNFKKFLAPQNIWKNIWKGKTLRNFLHPKIFGKNIWKGKTLRNFLLPKIFVHTLFSTRSPFAVRKFQIHTQEQKIPNLYTIEEEQNQKALEKHLKSAFRFLLVNLLVRMTFFNILASLRHV